MNGDIVYAARNLAENDEEIIQKASTAIGAYIEYIKASFPNSRDMLADRLEKKIARENKRFKANHDWLLAYIDEGECVYDISTVGSEHLVEAAMCMVRKSALEDALAGIRNS